ncbi:unnamed protein product [Closterium sp. NIES-65]|nr:unnamed protein product [Closterium sp. NIES-65]
MQPRCRVAIMGTAVKPAQASIIVLFQGRTATIALLLTLLLYLPLSAPHPINLSTLSASSSLPSIAHAHASVYPRAHASPFATHAMPVLLCALLYLLNMALDGVDGVVARRLRQVSAFGAILDVAVDNALRTAMWAAAVNSAMLTMNSVRLGMNSAGGSVLGINSARMLQAAAIIIPCVEWFTFACSHASTLGSASGSGSGSATRAHGNDTTALAEGAKGGVGVARQEQEQGVGEGQEHDSRGKGVEQGAGLKMRSKERSNWKDVWGGKNDSPLLVSLVMRNGFKTPVGVMAIAGLHFLPLWLFLRHHLHFFLTSLSHAYLQRRHSGILKAGGGRGSNGKAQVADEEEQDDKAEAVVGEAVAAVGEEQPREGWWIDSGASHNFTPYASDFKSKLQPPEVRGVRLGDGRVVKAVGMGEVPVVGAGGQLLRIQKVHLVPEMHTRLLSVPHLTSRDVIVTFKGKRCVLQRGERVLAIGEKERGRDHGLVRMFLPLAQGTQGSALAAKSSSSFSPLTLAHRRLGHTAPTTLQQMARGNSVLGFEIGGGNTDCSPCEPCLLGKSARKPFPHEASRALGPLDEVHMDLWGPVRTPSLGGAVYVLSLIDNFTRRVWSFPLPNKESAIVAKVLRQCHKDVELECGRKLKAVRSDRGGEFLGEAVKAWKAEFGIKTQLSVADTPQQNGVVERWHRTMAEGIRTLLVDSGLPARLWGEALMWVVWVKNRVTHSALPASITPMEAWSGQKPHVGMARIWGCMGSVMLHGHEKGGKLDARAVMCVCVGVDMESKGWRMLDPSIMRIRIARDVDFLENVMWKDWDKAKEFGELLQDAAAISQLLPLPLSPPSATADDVEMPLSPLPPAPLSVSVQQQPTPLQQLSGPSVIQRRSATQATSSSSSSSQRSIPLSTGAPPSPATTSPPPVTGLQALGIQSGTGGEEVGGDAGVVEGMLCLAREVEGVALAGVKEVLAQRYQMKDLGDLSMYLGVEVRRSVKDGWLEIGQEKYVRGL